MERSPEATENQLELFNLISDFGIDVIIGMFYLARKDVPDIIEPQKLIGVVIPFAEVYFNSCALWLYTREDPFINNKFDKMRDINVYGDAGIKYDPMDILQIIVMLVLNMIMTLDSGKLLACFADKNSERAKEYLKEVANDFIDLAVHFCGCSPQHVHAPVGPDDHVFTFALTFTPEPAATADVNSQSDNDGESATAVSAVSANSK